MTFRERFDSAVERIVTGPVLWYIACIGIGFWLALWTVGLLPERFMTEQNWPAVVQAIGSLLAVVIAVGVFYGEWVVTERRRNREAGERLWKIAVCIFFARVSIDSAGRALQDAFLLFTRYRRSYNIQLNALNELRIVDVPDAEAYWRLCEIQASRGMLEQFIDRRFTDMESFSAMDDDTRAELSELISSHCEVLAGIEREIHVMSLTRDSCYAGQVHLDLGRRYKMGIFEPERT